MTRIKGLNLDLLDERMTRIKARRRKERIGFKLYPHPTPYRIPAQILIIL